MAEINFTPVEEEEVPTQEDPKKKGKTINFTPLEEPVKKKDEPAPKQGGPVSFTPLEEPTKPSGESTEVTPDQQEALKKFQVVDEPVKTSPEDARLKFDSKRRDEVAARKVVEDIFNKDEKETNPLVTAKTKGTEVLGYQIPASGASTAAAVIGGIESVFRYPESRLKSTGALPTNFKEKDQQEIDLINRKISQYYQRAQDKLNSGRYGKKEVIDELTDFVNQGNERINQLLKHKSLHDQSKTKQWQKDLITWAVDRQEQGQKLSANLVNNLTDINDPIDAINWVAGALTESGVQIPASLATYGASAIGQEIGSVYMDAIIQTAKEKGITPKEVIDRGLDSPAAALTYGTTAGILDFLGAKGVAGGINKADLTKSLRKRALEAIASSGEAGLTESGTELSQTVLEKVGQAQATGQDFELKLSEAAEVVAKSFVGGSGVHTVMSSIPQREAAPKLPTKSIDQVVKDQVNTVKIDDVKSVEKAAETIQKEVETITKQADAVQKSSATEVLQREPGETGSAGGERGRVEPGVEGQEVTKEGQAQQAEATAQSPSEEIIALRETILNSPEDLKWDGKKVTILTEKGSQMLQRYAKLKDELQSTPPAAAAESPQQPATTEESVGRQEGQQQTPEPAPNAGQPAQEPSRVPPSTEQKELPSEQSGGTKTLKIAQRILDSDANESIKKGVKEKGADYIPKKIEVTDKEAKDLHELYGDDKAETVVRDTKNDVTPDTRIALSAKLYDSYKRQGDAATDPATKQAFYEKAVDVGLFTAEYAKELGRGVNAAKIMKAITSDEDLAVMAFEKHNKAVAKKLVAPIQKEVSKTKQQIDEEIRKIVEQKVQETVGERLKRAKLISTEQKKKISDAFDSLKIETPKGTANNIFQVVIPSVVNGAIEVTKQAVLTGADLANAVQAGIDYIREHHKGSFDEEDYRNLVSPVIQANEITTSPEQDKVQQAIKATEKSIAEYERKISEEDFTSKAKNKISSPELDALRKKRDDLKKQYNALKKQKLDPASIDPDKIKTKGLSAKKKKSLITQVVEEYNQKGDISDERFEELYAKQIGYKEFTPEERTKIRELAKVISEAEKFAQDIQENGFTKQKATQYQTLLQRAKKANQGLQEFARQPSSITDTLITIMQGNLLTPLSIVTNVYSNIALQPLRFTSAAIGSVIERGVNAVARLGVLDAAYKDPTIDLIAVQKGFIEGGWNGVMEGVNQLKNGNLADEKDLREIQTSFSPVRAIARIAEGDQTIKQKINDYIESTLGWPAEGMFRLLNLGDKPFRRAAEMSRAVELAEQKGLKGDDALKFLMFPDDASKIEIEKAGKEATFQQDTFQFFNKEISTKKAQEAISKVLNWVGDVKYIGPLAKILLKSQIPFVKTPLNIAVETIDYALPPLTLARGFYAIKNGDRRYGYTMIGKAFTGMMIMAAARQLFQLGLLSWEDDKDKKGRNMQYESVPPSALNVSALSRGLIGEGFEIQDDDIWVNYKKMGIIGIMFDNYTETLKKGSEEDAQMPSFPEQMVTNLVTIPKSVMEQSFLKGTNSLLNAIQDGGGYNTTNWAVETVGAVSAIVIPNTLATISKSSDEFIRDTYNRDIVERLKATYKTKLFMGDQLPPKVNVWGEPVRGNPEGRDKYIYYLFDPTKFKEVDTEGYKYKLYEAWKADNFNNDWLPASTTSNISVKGVNMKLTPEEKAQFATYVGQQRANAVSSYINSSWRYHTPEVRLKTLEKIYSDGFKKGKLQFTMQNGWNVKTKQALEEINKNR